MRCKIVSATVVKETFPRQSSKWTHAFRLEACTYLLGLLHDALCIILQRATLATIKERHPTIEATFIADLHAQVHQEMASINVERLHATHLLNLLEAFLSNRQEFTQLETTFHRQLPIAQLKRGLDLLAHKTFLQHGHTLLSHTQ